VIGHAPRQLDRNIAVVGRVIEGFEHLSTLPRG
jgi:peptidylprolyl isomerase